MTKEKKIIPSLIWAQDGKKQRKMRQSHGEEEGWKLQTNWEMVDRSQYGMKRAVVLHDLHGWWRRGKKKIYPMRSSKERQRKWVGELWENQIKQIKTWNRFEMRLAMRNWLSEKQASWATARMRRNKNDRVTGGEEKGHRSWSSSLLKQSRLSHRRTDELPGGVGIIYLV